MNGLDIAILVVMGLSALLGAIRGVLTEVLSLLVWVAALWLTVVYGDAVAAEFTAIETPLLRSLAGHAATFAVVVIVGNLLVWLIRTLVHGVGLSGPDRLLGAGFGVVRGYAIVLVGVLLVSFTPWAHGALWRDSTLMPAFSGPAEWITAQLPDASVLNDYTRPALDALPAVAASAADAFPAATGDAADANGLDLARAAQWAGLSAFGSAAPQAAEVPSSSPSGDAARVPPSHSLPADPAAVQRPSPESL